VTARAERALADLGLTPAGPAATNRPRASAASGAAIRPSSSSTIRSRSETVLEAATGEREWLRVALTARQARGLPKVTKVDRRFKPHRKHEAVEVEALGQGVVTGIIRAALDALLPEPLELVREDEAEQREHVRPVLEDLARRRRS
jgi:hypothetical protein